jgi:signal transduction protein with GAF and PtsI domain
MACPAEDNKNDDSLSSLAGVNPADNHGASYDKWQAMNSAFLKEINDKVSWVSELAGLIEQIILATQRALGTEASSVLLYDEKTDELYFEIVQGSAGNALRQFRMNAGSGIAGWVLRHAESLIVNDVSKDARFAEFIDKHTGFVTRSIMCVPLIINRRIIGVIELINKQDGTDFSERDLSTILPVAAVAAMAIENTKLSGLLKDGYKDTINALAAAIDAKDAYTRGHSGRVKDYALLCGAALLLTRE